MKEEQKSKTDIAESSGQKKALYKKPELKTLGKVTSVTFGSAVGFAESGQAGTFFQF